MPRHVILGAGPAGLNAIETIRRIDETSPITLVSDEPAYARMALPYFLSREIPAAQLHTASDAYLEAVGVERRLGKRAVRVDGQARSVHLDDGEKVPFDTLLVATGSSPHRLPIPGANSKHVHNLWTLDDAVALSESARVKRPRAVLVGGGFIGLIVLNALLKLGWKLALVELEGQILPRMLDRRGAEAVEAWLRACEVDVYTGVTCRSIEDGRRPRVMLSDGQTLAAHSVILSTGIRPNVEFLDGSGVQVAEGVLVDDRMQSSVPGIFAAGDVARGPDLLGGPAAIHAIQTTAVDQGRIAGANMAGELRRYEGSLLMNVLDVAGLHCASFGRWQQNGDTTVMWNPARPIYRKLCWDGSRLVGGIIVGPVEDATMLTDVGMLKGLIQARLDLGDWRAYLEERPWDLRRPYVASGAARRLLERTTLGAASEPRGYRFGDRAPRTDPGPHHAELVGSQPVGFDSLPKTPTPGIYKNPVDAGRTGKH